MVKNIKLHKNALYINDELITFDFDIDTLIVMDDKIIVLLDIPYDSSELDNIYAVNLSGKIIWRIEKVAKKFPKLRHDPYVGISMLDDKFGIIEYNGEKYGINIPSFSEEPENTSWKIVEEKYVSDWNFDWCNFIMGTELENWERDAIYCGQYRIDRQFQSGRKHKYPNYTKQDLKNNKVTGGLALFTGILASAEDSISSVYFKIVFEKDKFRRRVTIYAGSSDIKKLYDTYANDIPYCLYLEHHDDPFLTATEQNGIEKLYKKLTGKDMLTNLSVSADMHITIDREHKKMDYTSYLWFDGNTLMETPILCKNDKVEIGTTNILGTKFKPLLELDITGSSYASELMQKTFLKEIAWC